MGPAGRNMRTQRFGTATDIMADIYWTKTSGAHCLTGALRKKYSDISGPISKMGLPITDGMPIPNVTGGTMAKFEHGTML